MAETTDGSRVLQFRYILIRERIKSYVDLGVNSENYPQLAASVTLQ
jgi:hypothetical protein